ncbi:hypothetical protein L596_018499 [Steinernema carpocapsae]|uniref:Uncharacterized protein n=1 Tax=Steinernema carpocapsae TaxID=34508 RepID=A0A4U5N533_STECR|nr:hypothetical protein L596_018499 [Steinernema carpocapsae]
MPICYIEPPKKSDLGLPLPRFVLPGTPEPLSEPSSLRASASSSRKSSFHARRTAQKPLGEPPKAKRPLSPRSLRFFRRSLLRLCTRAAIRVVNLQKLSELPLSLLRFRLLYPLYLYLLKSNPFYLLLLHKFAALNQIFQLPISTFVPRSLLLTFLPHVGALLTPGTLDADGNFCRQVRRPPVSTWLSESFASAPSGRFFSIRHQIRVGLFQKDHVCTSAVRGLL